MSLEIKNLNLKVDSKKRNKFTFYTGMILRNKSYDTQGIKKVYYGEFYRDERIFDVAKRIGIELIHIKVDQSKL